MKEISKNQKGFTVVEGLLILLILAVIAAVGYMVYHNDHKTKMASKNTTTSTSKITSTVTYKTYSDSAAKASFQYPSTWAIANVKGGCDEPNGCAPSTDQINAQQITSPDGKIEIRWAGISGVGGYCAINTPPTQSNGCTVETVFSSTPISRASGLYVVEGAMEVSSGQYQPFLAVQDKGGVITSSKQVLLFFEDFKLPSTGNDTQFLMNNGNKDGTGVGAHPQNYATTREAQTYLNSSDVIQAKQILLSLNVQ